jgi:hypothetical protein
MDQQAPKVYELLEKGLLIVRKVVDQGVHVTRDEMCDYLNFEVTVNSLISSMKAAEGKSQEELLELAKKAIAATKE